jgi:hypothetical protein
VVTAEVDPEELVEAEDWADEVPLLCVVVLLPVVLAGVLDDADEVVVSAAMTAPVETNIATAEVATHLRMVCVRRRRAASRSEAIWSRLSECVIGNLGSQGEGRPCQRGSASCLRFS